MDNKNRNNQITSRPIMFIVRILKMVLPSAAEAEVASSYHVYKKSYQSESQQKYLDINNQQHHTTAYGQ